MKLLEYGKWSIIFKVRHYWTQARSNKPPMLMHQVLGVEILPYHVGLHSVERDTYEIGHYTNGTMCASTRYFSGPLFISNFKPNMYL